MTDLCKILEECIGISNEIYYFALKENIEQIRMKYATLSSNIKNLCIIMSDSDLMPAVVRQMEELYSSLEIGDCIKVLDIAGFEMKPILIQCLESMGK